MNFAQPTSPASTWLNATRTLTGFNGAITVNGGADNQTLANGSTAGFVAAANTMGLVTVVGIALASVTWNIGLISGATFRSGVQGVSGSSLQGHGCRSTTLGIAINNSGTVSGNYSFASIVWNV